MNHFYYLLKQIGVWSLLFYTNALFSQLPPDFNDQLVSIGWSLANGITFDEEGNMYVWEKSGIVYMADDEGNKISTPLIDISEEVGNWRDHGLLGLALHPNFTSNGYIYLYYAVDKHHLLYHGTDQYDPAVDQYFEATIGRITRYTVDVSSEPKQLIPDSRKVLLGDAIHNGIPLLHESHGIGSLVFGIDGSLLVSAGDGASYNGADRGGPNISGAYNVQAVEEGIISPAEDVGAFRAQMIQSLSGKILRLDPETGDGLESNPFFDKTQPRSAASRVWALGFRNPFRFSVKPGSGSHDVETGNPGVLYVGDVGWVFWEEIDIVSRGGMNFGWPTYDGMDWGGEYNWQKTFNRLVPNLLYDTISCPDVYISFQDLILPGNNDPDRKLVHPCDPTDSIPRSLTPIFYHQAPAITWNNFLWTPDTLTFISTEDEHGQRISLPLADPTSPVEGKPFNGTCSVGGVFYTGNSYPDEYALTYLNADFSGWIRKFDYDTEDHIIQVDRFHDDCGPIVNMAVHPIDGSIYYIRYYEGHIRKISYKGNPPPSAIIQADQQFGVSPLTVQFNGSSSFDPEGQSISYLWDFGNGDTSTQINPVYTFELADGRPGSFEVKLTVTDSLGVSNTEQMIISPNNSPPTVSIQGIQDKDVYPINGPTLLPLTAEVVDAEQEKETLSYAWEIFLHHNTHFHPEPIDSSTSTQVLLDPLGCGDEIYYYRIKLTITDDQGLSAFQEVELFPYCGPLISDLSLFQLKETSDAVQLGWNMEVLTNGMEFDIERSADGRSFVPIGKLPALTNESTYTFSDREPIRGENYYRIKTRQSNGAYDYSEVQSLVFPTIFPFPNPVTYNLFIQFDQIHGRARFELSDLSGKLIKQVVWEGDEEEQSLKGVDLSEIPHGVYLYRISDGRKDIVGKVVK